MLHHLSLGVCDILRAAAFYSAIFPPRSSKASAADALRPAAPCAWRAVPSSLSHHLSLGVCDILRAAAFYDAVLALLGYARVWSDIRRGEPGQAIGCGPPGGGDKPCLKDHGTAAAAPGPGFHIAFAAPSRGAVDAFHRAALAAGGRDNGAPGLRLPYGPTYYAAFIIDPDEHRIEAVCKDPAGPPAGR